MFVWMTMLEIATSLGRAVSVPLTAGDGSQPGQTANVRASEPHPRRAGIAFGLFTLGALICGATGAETDGVVGHWKTIDDNSGKPRSVVELFKADGKLHGKIVKLFPEPGEDPNPLCEVCPGDRANQPVVGMTIVNGLERGEEKWENGLILDPENGKEYRCEIWREGDNLRVRGYLLLFYRTQTWERGD